MEIKILNKEDLSPDERGLSIKLENKLKFYESLIKQKKENKNILYETDFCLKSVVKDFLNLVSFKKDKTNPEEGIERVTVKYLSNSHPVIYTNKNFSKQISFVTLTKKEFRSFYKLFFIEGEIVKTSLENLESLFGKIFFSPELNSLSHVLKEVKSKDFKESEKNRERFLRVDKIYTKEPLTKNIKDFMLEHMDSLTDFPRNISNHVLKIKFEEIETFDMVEKPYMELF